MPCIPNYEDLEMSESKFFCIIIFLISVISTSCSDFETLNSRSNQAVVKKEGFSVSASSAAEYKVTIICPDNMNFDEFNIKHEDFTVSKLKRLEDNVWCPRPIGELPSLDDVNHSVTIQHSSDDSTEFVLPEGFIRPNGISFSISQETFCTKNGSTQTTKWGVNVVDIQNDILDFYEYRKTLREGIEKYRCKDGTISYGDLIFGGGFVSEVEGANRMHVVIPPNFIDYNQVSEPTLDLTLAYEKVRNFNTWYNKVLGDDESFERKKRIALDNYNDEEASYYRFTRYHHWVAGNSEPSCAGVTPPGLEKKEYCVLGEGFVGADYVAEWGEGFGFEETLLTLADIGSPSLGDAEVDFEREIDCSLGNAANLSQSDQDFCNDSNNWPCIINQGIPSCSRNLPMTIPDKKQVNTVTFEGKTYLANRCYLSLEDFTKKGDDPQFRCDMGTAFEEYAAQHVASNSLSTPEKFILGLDKAGKFFGTLAAFIAAPELTVTLMAAHILEKGIVNHESALKIAGELALAIGSLYPPILVGEMLVGLAINIERVATADCDNTADFNQSCAGIYEDLGLNLAMIGIIVGKSYLTDSVPLTRQHLQVGATREETKPLLSDDHLEKLGLKEKDTCESNGAGLVGGFSLTCRGVDDGDDTAPAAMPFRDGDLVQDSNLDSWFGVRNAGRSYVGDLGVRSGSFTDGEANVNLISHDNGTPEDMMSRIRYNEIGDQRTFTVTIREPLDGSDPQITMGNLEWIGQQLFYFSNIWNIRINSIEVIYQGLNYQGAVINGALLNISG